MRRLCQYLVVAMSVVLAGCSTINSRIRDKAAVFDRLSPAEQAEIRQGIIAVGFTPDMVYMALGRPDEVRERTGPHGLQKIWRYDSYYDRYEGTVHVGYRRFIYWDPHVRGYRIYYEPVYRNVYRPERETYYRITFTNGKVSVIEETKS